MALVRVNMKIWNKEGNVKFCKNASFCQSTPLPISKKKKKKSVFFLLQFLNNTQYLKYLNIILKNCISHLKYTHILFPLKVGFWDGGKSRYLKQCPYVWGTSSWSFSFPTCYKRSLWFHKWEHGAARTACHFSGKQLC